MIESGSRMRITLDWLDNEMRLRKSGKGYQGNGWDWKSVGHGDGVGGKWIRMVDCSQEHWEFYQIEIFLTAISDFPLHTNYSKRL